MKFAFVTTMRDWPWGGSEELWSRTALQLAKHGHSTLACIFDWSENRSRAEALRKQGIEVVARPGNEAGLSQRILRKFTGERASFRRLRAFAPDLVVISQGHNAGGFDWARFCQESGLPFSIIVHCNCELWWFQNRELSSAVSAYTSARKVYCVSRANLDLLRFQLGESLPHSSVIWNPHNVNPDLLPAWPASEPLFRVASVARLEPAAKGQDILLRLMAQPKWRDRPLHVSFYGSGPYEAELRRIADSLRIDRVTFRGHTSDVGSIWEQNHLLALPSRYEGLPLALVEAMWCGRPAVVTNVGGNAELCLHGTTGFVAPAATYEAFEEALEQAWQNRHSWRECGERARSRAEQLIPRDPVGLFCDELISSVEVRRAQERVVEVAR